MVKKRGKNAELYKKSGVDISLGDKSSAIAYREAKKTFPGRAGKIGKPLLLEGGFTGMIDMGDYYLVQNDDGIGSKFQIADEIGEYDTSGYDLAAMVADDAVCVGAECITISNTIDTEKVDPTKIEKMMKSLSRACREQKIIIPGGEIAELPSMVRGTIWNATAIGIVEKKKFIDAVNVRPGNALIGLYSKGFRSNGFSLVRCILKKTFGTNWHNKKFNTGAKSKKFSSHRTWAETVLEPTQIYHNAILALTGRFGEPRRINIKGIAHITGGGIPGNLNRILRRSRTGALLDNLPDPPKMMVEIQRLGRVEDSEAYKVWNMGIGMILAVSQKETSAALALLAKQKIRAQIIGRVTSSTRIELISKGNYSKNKTLKFSV